jgi:hypothetical protein
MAYIVSVLATLLLVVLQTDAANITVGNCLTIESKKYPGRLLYDSGPVGKYWVYTSGKPPYKTHHWKVKSQNGTRLKFQNVHHPSRCLCERYAFLWMYAATCDCNEKDPAQEWDLEGTNNTVRFKRPNEYRYSLKDCPNTSCAYVATRLAHWVLKNVDCPK